MTGLWKADRGTLWLDGEALEPIIGAARGDGRGFSRTESR